MLFFSSKLQTYKANPTWKKMVPEYSRWYDHLHLVVCNTIPETQLPETKLFSQTLVDKKTVTKHSSPLAYLHNTCTSIWLTFSCLNIKLFRLIRNILQRSHKNFYLKNQTTKTKIHLHPFALYIESSKTITCVCLVSILEEPKLILEE